ncbi:aminotransferase class V-fold PLP-dependent enzyme [Cyanobacterium aponinum UTEX 3222]|uniref:cysteine desulfurase n=1 Tax=Cyanobacterium aponinum (strain PCC 10605) TaxID=755178 RepID=K9Z8P2_CYAAP|nr:aminotransferase class V-fold PLP-dependent enzyme [Cyanobacterium aponinum]AFZ55097.1 Cysteine desulfurase [Cyanobacterium aponinum PCC 10605]WRL40029.1 aminotransferase class V-fold PLP-dependent enzyme [Cyanobacterium aponinum UTEX 3221]WRL42919.1 aminotransferase class V-fold PLP-dependent enzyme [Cyanobacterium aponinum UTEX 3222]
MRDRPIYLDGHATTQVDERVIKAMMPYFTEYFGNPSSNAHVYGWEAQAGVKKARDAIASAINAEPREIIFTSGATEANNLAIKGVAEAYFQKGRHIITVETEHRAVIEPCEYLQSLGFEITFLPVEKNGLLNLELLTKTIREDTILVSVMTANNEIGVIQDIEKIGAICRENEVIFHTDSAQAIGKIPLDVQKMNVDLMSFTAHKIHGIKGIGALYIRAKNPRVNIASQIQGGGQERGYRSGTLCTPQIVGFAEAINIALKEMEQENQRQKNLRDYLWQELKQLDGIYLNGDLNQRLAGNLNISVEGVNGSALLLALQSQIAVSSGSACSSTSTKPSHVLKALGYSDELARASLRFGIGRFNTFEEIKETASFTLQTIKTLRR